MPLRNDDTLVAEKLSRFAADSDTALALGNRAGVVEWANAAWTRITGYALERAVSKPVAAILGEAGVEKDVVDFVQQHFLEGRRCQLELPLERPDGRKIWLHLEVHALRDELGEVSDFVAIGRDVTSRKLSELEGARPETSTTAQRIPSAKKREQAVDLSALMQDLASNLAESIGARTQLDVALEAGLPLVPLPGRQLSLLLRTQTHHSLRAIADEWGTLTLSSGRVRRRIGHDEWRDEGKVFIEIHDTGRPTEFEASNAAAHASQDGTGRALALALLCEFATEVESALRIESRAGFGTCIRLEFPTGPS